LGLLAPIATTAQPREDGEALKGTALFEALEHRETTRRFLPDPLPPPSLDALLWAAHGLNRGGQDARKRTAPASFGERTIRVYVAGSDGIRLDDPSSGRRDLVCRQDVRKKVSKLMKDRDAPIVLLLIGDRETLSRSATRTGYTLGEPMMTAILYADATAVAENVYLASAALSLGTGIVADLDPAFILSALGLDPGRFVPIFALPVGKPAPEPVHGAPPPGPTGPGLPGQGPVGLDESPQE